MSVPAVNQAATWLVKELTAAHVFEAAQLAPYLAEFKALHRGGDALALADYLVKSGLLTPYQHDRVLAREAARLVLGPYLLAEPIGSGSFGEVYQAIGRSDRKRYAVKVLPLRSLWNVRQAKAQVELFAHLPAHPTIVPFVDVDTAGGSHYLVWPFVEGYSLAHRVREKGPASVPVALMLMLQAAEGLAVCHAHGIAHGLFNPSNVLIGPDGQVRILDLGVGAILSENIADDESMLDTMSAANATLGMLECCAPETLNSPTLRDPAGDAYSFGCVFYFLLTGRLPFPDGNIVDKVLAHQTQPPPSARAANPAVPDWLDKLIRQLMAKAPADRPASMAEVAATLHAEASNAFVELPAVAPPAVTPPPSLAAKPQIHIDTPHYGAAATPTPTPTQVKAGAPARALAPPSASEIDFGDYAPPAEDAWPAGRPAADGPAAVVPLTLEEAPPSRLFWSSPRPVRRDDPDEADEPRRKRRSSGVVTHLPAPVTYTPPTDPAATAAAAVPQNPSLAKSWWRRLRGWFRSLRARTSDVVQLSVFGPAQVSPGDSIRLQVFAHNPGAFESVNTLSRAFHMDSTLLATGYLADEVERGALLGLHLKVTNAGVANSSLELTWLGQPQPRAFDLHVPWESPAGMTPVALRAEADGKTCGEVAFQLHILPRRG